MSEYIWGDSREEFLRLKAQNHLWSTFVTEHWEAGGLNKDDVFLDFGCGPGFVSMDVAEKVRTVLAFDASQESLDYVRELARREKKTNVVVLPSADASAFPIESIGEHAPTFIYARWVFMYLGVEKARQALTLLASVTPKRGRVLLHDFINYRSAKLFPESLATKRVVNVFYDRMVENGHNPDIGFSLPGLLAEAGFDITWSRTLSHLAMPKSKMWTWPQAFFDLHVKGLREAGHITAAEFDAFWLEWERARMSPKGCFYTWPTLQIVAQKR